MTQEELQTLVEDEIASCLGHIQRGESVVFYEGKLSGLTLMREKLCLLTQRAPDAGTSSSTDVTVEMYGIASNPRR